MLNDCAAMWLNNKRKKTGKKEKKDDFQWNNSVALQLNDSVRLQISDNQRLWKENNIMT